MVDYSSVIWRFANPSETEYVADSFGEADAETLGAGFELDAFIIGRRRLAPSSAKHTKQAGCD